MDFLEVQFDNNFFYAIVIQFPRRLPPETADTIFMISRTHVLRTRLAPTCPAHADRRHEIRDTPHTRYTHGIRIERVCACWLFRRESYDFREINDVTAIRAASCRVRVASRRVSETMRCPLLHYARRALSRARTCNHAYFFFQSRMNAYDGITGSSIGRLRVNTVGYPICSFTRRLCARIN